MSIKQTKTEQKLRSVIQAEIANGENSDQSETYQIPCTSISRG